MKRLHSKAHQVPVCCRVWSVGIYPRLKLALGCAEHGVISTLPPLSSEGHLEGLSREMSQSAQQAPAAFVVAGVARTPPSNRV